MDFKKLEQAQLPLIVHWDRNHFVVVYQINRGKIYLAVPAYGLIQISKEEFISRWIGNNASVDSKEGITLLLEPPLNSKK